MNLSHVITEFSFGPYFPDITQPLDNSFELTNDREISIWLSHGPNMLNLNGSFCRLSILLTCGTNHLCRTTIRTTQHAPIQCDTLYAGIGT